MNPEQPFPDDREFNLPSSLARIEQQLKRQQPQPVALDAEAILRAALQDDSRPSRRWFALGASWIGGALAGSLLTAFVLSRAGDSHMTVNSIRTTSRTPVTEITTRKSEAQLDASRDRKRPDDDREEVLHWSQSEFLVSNRILNLGRSAPGVPRLQAGSYVQLSAMAGIWPVFGTPGARSIDRSDTTSAEASPEGDPSDTADINAADVPAPIASEIKRDDLLRELLLDHTGSTL